jgi:hypothetical protein
MTIEKNTETEHNDSDRATLPFNPSEAVDLGDDFDDSAAAEPATELAAPAEFEPPTIAADALRDLTPAAARDESEREPARDASGDVRPYLNGEALLAALKYALIACPKPSDDDSLLSYVVFARDETRGRISFTACDTTRWHQSFVACEKGIDLHGTFRLPKADVQRLKDFLTTAVERGSFCNVRPKSDSIGVCSWEIAFGETHPIVIDTMPGFAHENWEPPAFSVGAGAGAAAMHDAKHVAKAMSIALESTRVLRDEVDSSGRRHVTIGDEFGHEVARAVLVQLGFSEGEPRSPQEEIPGTLGSKDRMRTAAPTPIATKKSKPAKPAKSAAKAAKAKSSKAKKRR